MISMPKRMNNPEAEPRGYSLYNTKLNYFMSAESANYYLIDYILCGEELHLMMFFENNTGVL